MDRQLKCPECGELVQAKQPVAWNPKWGPAPDASHLDGEPLCPVIGDSGYEPAKLPEGNGDA